MWATASGLCGARDGIRNSEHARGVPLLAKPNLLVDLTLQLRLPLQLDSMVRQVWLFMPGFSLPICKDEQFLYVEVV